jgi:hypothetical protein
VHIFVGHIFAIQDHQRMLATQQPGGVFIDAVFDLFYRFKIGYVRTANMIV